MKSTAFALAAAFLSFSDLVTAQFTNQSAPFRLVLQSDDAAFNGVTLGSCHEGAAIEALCLGDNSTYQFNSSAAELVTAAGAQGYLTYILEGSGFNVSETMSLFFDVSTNVALPLFQPSGDEGTLVAFDSNNLMNIQDYLNDTVSPPTDETSVAYYRWGYVYSTLNWAVGAYPPENPTCCPVNVRRIFV